ncbi:hypothetical protein [Persephonella sp.]
MPREKLLISKTSKAEANVSPDGEYIYLEIYKKIGETERDGRKLPLFYDNGKKDSQTAKFNLTEWAVLIKGMEIFANKGVKGFQEFAKRINGGSEKLTNLMFVHGNRTMGLRAYEGKDGKQFIGFSIREGKELDYSAFTASLTEVIGLAAKMKGLFDIAMQLKHIKALQPEAKAEADMDTPITEEEDIPDIDIEEETGNVPSM